MKKTPLLLSILFLTQIIIAGEIKQPVSSRYGYIENKGQIIDQNNQLNPAVKFLYNGNGLNVQLKANSFSYDTYTIERIKSPSASPRTGEQGDVPPLRGGQEGLNEDIIYHFHRIDIEFIGANKSPEIIAEQPSEDYTNYYTTGTPEEGVTFVRTYQKVTYRNLYEGIDLEFSTPPKSPEGGLGPRNGNSPLLGRGAGEVASRDGSSSPSGRLGGVKYNFIIHPGADASQIKWKYNGALNSSLKDGKIILTVEQGDLEEKLPVSFINETSQKVNVNYFSLDNNVFGFSIPVYNKNSTLIIDPVPWATYFGGNSVEPAFGIALDAGGNSVITGYTSSTNVIATTGAFQTTYAGAYLIGDAYIAKFNASGSRLWSTYYGGSSDDIGHGISIDPSGNIVIAGTTSSTSNIATSGAFQTSISGSNDAFIAKFSSSGSRLWGTYYGGDQDEYCYGISIDTSGKIVIIGKTYSYSGIATTGAFQTTLGGGLYDAFIAKFNASGSSLLWGTYYGGTGNEDGNRISIEASGNIIITGNTNSMSGIATSGAFQTTSGGGSFLNNDAFIAKFDTTGYRLWGTYYGGSGDDLGVGISIDPGGNIVITGYTSSTSAIASTGAFQSTYGGGTYDAFITKFNSSCSSRLWGTYCGGGSTDYAHGISIDASGNIAITGQTNSSSGIASTGAFQTTYGGVWDAFITKFNTSGSRLWSTYFGGSGDDGSDGISVDINGNIAITGRTNSSSGIATTGTFQTTIGGSADAFIATFTPNGGLPVNLTSFDAKPVNDNKEVLLNWQTASELNNDHFEIERSMQSAQCSDNCWEVIGTVKGNGTTSMVSNYEFVDEMLKQVQHDGTVYYRLKQVDVDGKFEYSKIVSVSFDRASATDIIVSPNPNNGLFYVTLPNIANTNIEVFDLLGNKVHSTTLNSSAQINLSQLNKGIYFLKYVSENGMQTKKVVIE